MFLSIFLSLYFLFSPSFSPFCFFSSPFSFLFFPFFSSDSREGLLAHIRQVDQATQDLARKTKVAAGVWPPVGAAKDMVLSAFDLFRVSRDAVFAGNATGLVEIVEDKEDEADGRMTNFTEYKRVTALNLIGQIAEVEKTSQSVVPTTEQRTNVENEGNVAFCWFFTVFG